MARSRAGSSTVIARCARTLQRGEQYSGLRPRPAQESAVPHPTHERVPDATPSSVGATTASTSGPGGSTSMAAGSTGVAASGDPHRQGGHTGQSHRGLSMRTNVRPTSVARQPAGTRRVSGTNNSRCPGGGADSQGSRRRNPAGAVIPVTSASGGTVSAFTGQSIRWSRSARYGAPAPARAGRHPSASPHHRRPFDHCRVVAVRTKPSHQEGVPAVGHGSVVSPCQPEANGFRTLAFLECEPRSASGDARYPVQSGGP
jgi:hypothetical protein